MIVRPNIAIVVLDDVKDPTAGPKSAFLKFLRGCGAYFPNYYTMAGCSASRASLLTGLYPARHGVGELVNADETFELSLSHPSLFQVATAAGYGRRAVGKWHLLGDASPRVLTDPLDRGAQRWRGPKRNLGGTQSGTYYSWDAVVDGTIQHFTSYNTEQLAQWAAEEMGAMAEPWLLWLAFNASHKPFHVPPSGTYATPAVDDLGKFRAATEAADRELALLWASMPPAVRENTLWLVFGDNGDPTEVEDPDVPTGQGKGTVGEGGVNGTLLTWHPQVLPGFYPQLVNITDVYATVQDAVGDLGPRPQDSVSFWGLLNGSAWTPRPWAFSQKHEPNGFVPASTQKMAREARYKLRHYLTGTALTLETLHDLQTAPPGEDGPPLDLGDLSAEQQVALDLLRAAILASS